MRVPRRHVIGPGCSFHKVWRCHNREPLLRDHREKLAYLEAIHADYTERCSRDDFAIHGYCIMSNHGHEKARIKRSQAAFSRHMQRAHGVFGQRYNRRHGRLGKVAHDRPKTIRIEDDAAEMRCSFYIDCNPVRAGLIKHPTDPRWKDFSSCGYYALGRKNRFDDMIEFPGWYLRLGRTWNQRRRRYRSLLDRYLVEHGLKRDPRMTRGHFLGAEAWVAQMRRALSQLLGRRTDAPPGADG